MYPFVVRASSLPPFSFGSAFLFAFSLSAFALGVASWKLALRNSDKSHSIFWAVSFRGGSASRNSAWVEASRKRMKFLGLNGPPGCPLCPAHQNENFPPGNSNGSLRYSPVNCSPLTRLS